MDLVQDNQGTLMAIEGCAVRVWRANKTITDGDMLIVYEKLANVFNRRHKKLPELQTFVTANQKQLFLDLKELCIGFVENEDGERADNLVRMLELAGGTISARQVSDHTMMQLHKRLCQSVKTLSGMSGKSDYFRQVERYLPG